MISYERDPQQTIPESSVKIIGLGGAGANMLDRIALDGLSGAEMLCMNTDMRTLMGSVAEVKIQIGAELTKGLGCGGDPHLGLQAAQESEEEIRAAVRGHKMIFLCVGLGGGTGSGAAPLITRIAREENAFVLIFATMPFAFEGPRRKEQAEASLNELAVLASALVTFDNGRMGELVLAKQGIHEAFSAADRMISESIKAVTRLVVRPGLINIGLDDLMTALRTTRSRCLFGSGLAKGENRSHLALENALASPLLDKGGLLRDATTVLVHICGGESLTLYEVELLMQNLGKYIPSNAHVLFGAAVDPTMEDNLSVTVISALPEDQLIKADARGQVVATNIEPSERSEEILEVKTDPKEACKKEAEEAKAQQAKETKDEPASDLPDEVSSDSAQAEVDKVEEEKATEKPEEKTEGGAEKELNTEEKAKDLSTANDDESQKLDLSDKSSDKKPAAEPEETTKSSHQTKNVEVKGKSEKAATSEEKSKEEPSKEVEKEEQDSDGEPEESKREEVENTSKLDELALEADGKKSTAQPELQLDGAPKGRFEGEGPNFHDGEDLDIPPFLRKKRR